MGKLFDEGELDRQIAEGRRLRQEMQRAGAASGGFNPLSLGHWLSLCAAARVPAVPALSLGRIAIDVIMSEDPAARAFEKTMAAQMAVFGMGWMARWDCCAMAETKWRLSKGEHQWDPALADIFAEDMRALDLIGDFPDTEIEGWARPWMSFAIHSGWPIEYRVFVQNDRIIGVSNYYPQRQLQDDGETKEDIRRATDMALRLIGAQKRRLNCPRLSGFDMGLNHWTADFGRLQSGAIIFLEGGPPHASGGGAHPCCFEPGKIDGVALSARWDCAP